MKILDVDLFQDGPMIPVVGMASTGGKFVVKGSNAIGDAQNASKAADNVKVGVAKDIDNAKQGDKSP